MALAGAGVIVQADREALRFYALAGGVLSIVGSIAIAAGLWLGPVVGVVGGFAFGLGLATRLWVGVILRLSDSR